jgi:hypothetical protein
LVNPVRVFRESYPKARQHAIRVGLLEFIFIRLLSTRLGQDFGILRGGTVRDVAASSIKDAHRSKNDGKWKRAAIPAAHGKEREIAASHPAKAGWPANAAEGTGLPSATARR